MRYRKKPVVIDAMQFTDEHSGHRIIEWTRGSTTPASWTMEVRGCCAENPDGYDYPVLRVKTLESGDGHHVVSVGDWVIRGVNGEHYPCKPDIFAFSYEAVQ
jgi:hypothetical protein